MWLSLLVPATAAVLAWSLLSGASAGYRIAATGLVVGLLYVQRRRRRFWLSHALAAVAVMAALLTLRHPGIGAFHRLNLWLSFATIAAAILFLVSRLKVQRQILDSARGGPLRDAFALRADEALAEWRRSSAVAEYGLAVIAPMAGALIVWHLLGTWPDVVRSAAVLAVLLLLVHGIVTRPIWVIYAVGTVAVLMPLTVSGLPGEAGRTLWMTVATVAGIVVFLVARLRVQAAQLSEAAERRARFVALTNHELRTPVTVLHSMLETLEDDLQTALGPQQRAFLEAAYSSSDTLATRLEMLSQLQELQELPDKDDGHRAPFEDVLHDVEVRYRRAMQSRGMELGTSVSPRAARTAVPATDARTTLAQLIDNAVKFGPEGSRVAVRAWIEGGDLVCDVADEGPGIAPADRAAIFDSFYQAGDLMRRTSEGLGIGLAMSRLAVRRMGGTIGVRNRVAGGACFTLRVPVEQKGLFALPAGPRDRVPA